MPRYGFCFDMIERLFYTPNIDGTTGSEYLLNEEESNHCVKVLRLGCGGIVHLTDGKGTLLQAAIVQIMPKACKVRIVERFDRWEARPYHLHLAVAPTKSMERYEWMVEKVTEVGVDEVTPVICARSERKVFKTDRLERIAVAAIKQSLKTLLPIIHPATSFHKLIDTPFDGIKLMAHCGSGARISLEEALATSNPQSGARRCLILIGPEGDFTPEEVTDAEAKGFQSVHLGASRLRTETAGVVATIGVYLEAEGGKRKG